ncbi:MAG: hypothetical protein SGI74_08100 [Oligoflexia bacterium]|nr:hypothetical protein [Oligoflexia bacterium]
MGKIHLAAFFLFTLLLVSSFQNCGGSENTLNQASSTATDKSDAGYGPDLNATNPASNVTTHTPNNGMPSSVNRQSIAPRPIANMGLDSFYDDEQGRALCEAQNDSLGRPCCCIANGVDTSGGSRNGQKLIKRACNIDSEANKSQCLNWNWSCKRFNHGNTQYFERTAAGFQECLSYPTDLLGKPALTPPCTHHCCHSKYMKYNCYADDDDWWEDKSRQRRCLKVDGSREAPEGEINGCIHPKPNTPPPGTGGTTPPPGYGPPNCDLQPNARACGGGPRTQREN